MQPIVDDMPANLLALQEALASIEVEELAICTWLARRMLRAKIAINVGKYAGSARRVGWSFPDDSQPYPEYAPPLVSYRGEVQ